MKSSSDHQWDYSSSKGNVSVSFSRSVTEVHDNLSLLPNDEDADKTDERTYEPFQKDEFMQKKIGKHQNGSKVNDSPNAFSFDKYMNTTPSKKAPEQSSRLGTIEPKSASIKLMATKSFLNPENRLNRYRCEEDDEDVLNSQLQVAKENESSSINDIGADLGGTPGYIALQANASIRVTKLQKILRKIGIPKIQLFFERILKQIPRQHKGYKAPIIPDGVTDREGME